MSVSRGVSDGLVGHSNAEAASTDCKEPAPDVPTSIHDLHADRWLHVVAAGGSYRLTIYQQEEELAPPWPVSEVTISPERLRVLLSVMQLSGPDHPVTVAEVEEMAKGSA
jgi:hypothetical protein